MNTKLLSVILAAMLLTHPAAAANCGVENRFASEADILQQLLGCCDMDVSWGPNLPGHEKLGTAAARVPAHVSTDFSTEYEFITNGGFGWMANK